MDVGHCAYAGMLSAPAERKALTMQIDGASALRPSDSRGINQSSIRSRTATFHNGFQEQRESSSWVLRSTWNPYMFCTTPNDLRHGLSKVHFIFFHAIFFFVLAPSSVMDPSNPLTNLTIFMFEAEKNCTPAGAFRAHNRQFQDDRDSFPLLSLRELITFCSNATVANATNGNLVDWYNFIDTTAAEPFERTF